jgi:hypothetical protein
MLAIRLGTINYRIYKLASYPLRSGLVQRWLHREKRAAPFAARVHVIIG